MADQKQELLDVAVQACQTAQDIVLKHFDNTLSIEYKDNHSPVTIADKEAEEAIRSIIQKTFPSHSFIGEEFGTDTNEGEITWIIDPIDGTKSYARNMPYFSIEIAAWQGGKPLAAVSNAPLLQSHITAVAGAGAYKNGKKIHVSNVASLSDAYIDHGSVKYFIQKNFIDGLDKLSQKTFGTKGFTDCWGNHLVAEGKFDAHVQAGVKIWDIGASCLIIQEAGGAISDIQGNPISYEVETYIASNGILHNQLVELFT